MTVRRRRSVEAIPQPVSPHSFIAKAVHWGFIGVFVYAVAKQLDDVEQLEDLSLLQHEMTFACIFLATLLARYVFMAAMYHRRIGDGIWGAMVPSWNEPTDS